MHLILVEDKIPLSNSLAKILRSQGYVVDQVFDGQQALDLIDEQVHDLVILDLTLPKVDGLQVMTQLRQQGFVLPILVLTARSAVKEIVLGLNQGADDYLVKPFEIEELLARVQALLRREGQQKQQLITLADLVFNPHTGEVKRAGKKINLTQTEFRLLQYLLMKRKWVVSKQELLAHVWQDQAAVYDRVVDTYICFLRRKIDKAFPHSPPLLHTIKTRGYQLGILSSEQ